MSFKKNVVAGYVSQLYVTVVGLLILPLYLKYMGAEAYGLVGFFTMLQAWFNLLDIGFTPTVARETARFRGGAVSALAYRRLLRALQIIFLVVASLGGGAMFVFSGTIASEWLNAKILSVEQVQQAVQLMAIGAALRWMSGLYRGCISGSERLVWLSGFNSFVATLRFVGVLPILMFVGHSPKIFFSYQLLVAMFELIGLVFKAHSLFPRMSDAEKIGWSLDSLFFPVKSVLKFSLVIAVTSSVWVLITQTDKLVLSKLLSLTDYGYFTLAVLAASGVMVIAGPISGALLPRMARLHAGGDEAGLIDIYRNATQMVAVIALPVCFVLVFFAEKVLQVWTGDMSIAAHAAPVLRLYAIGNGFLAFSAFPYYLQYSKGDLRLHFIGSFVFLLLLIPSLIWATWRYGTVGAGYAWLVSNGMYFMVWVPFVHARVSRGLHRKWLLNDLIPMFLLGLFAASLLHFFLPWPQERSEMGAVLFLCGAVVFIFCALSSRKMRGIFNIGRLRLVN